MKVVETSVEAHFHASFHELGARVRVRVKLRAWKLPFTSDGCSMECSGSEWKLTQFCGLDGCRWK